MDCVRESVSMCIYISIYLHLCNFSCSSVYTGCLYIGPYDFCDAESEDRIVDFSKENAKSQLNAEYDMQKQTAPIKQKLRLCSDTPLQMLLPRLERSLEVLFLKRSSWGRGRVAGSQIRRVGVVGSDSRARCHEGAPKWQRATVQVIQTQRRDLL